LVLAQQKNKTFLLTDMIAGMIWQYHRYKSQGYRVVQFHARVVNKNLLLLSLGSGSTDRVCKFSVNLHANL